MAHLSSIPRGLSNPDLIDDGLLLRGNRNLALGSGSRSTGQLSRVHGSSPDRECTEGTGGAANRAAKRVAKKGPRLIQWDLLFDPHDWCGLLCVSTRLSLPISDSLAMSLKHTKGREHA